MLAALVSHWEKIFGITEFDRDGRVASIKIRGEHLDEFSYVDKFYIVVNKLLTVLYVHNLGCLLQEGKSLYGHKRDLIVKDFSSVTLSNSLGSLCMAFLLYDLFYGLFHRVLHQRWCYRYIHKHHHRQRVPTRGNKDAINVHPIEFIVGEWMHILCILIIPETHVVTLVLFIGMSGILASLNHTRLPVRLPFGIFDVRFHDQHHVFPTCNYGQYHMGWDYLFNTFRAPS